VVTTLSWLKTHLRTPLIRTQEYIRLFFRHPHIVVVHHLYLMLRARAAVVRLLLMVLRGMAPAGTLATPSLRSIETVLVSRKMAYKSTLTLMIQVLQSILSTQLRSSIRVQELI
jgi:hypothetical protein